MPRTWSIALLGLMVALFVAPHMVAASFTFTTIDFLSAFSTFANGINDSGQVVGTYVSDGVDLAFC